MSRARHYAPSRISFAERSGNSYLFVLRPENAEWNNVLSGTVDIDVKAPDGQWIAITHEPKKLSAQGKTREEAVLALEQMMLEKASA